MTPLKVLKQAVAAFESKGLKYCLVGGHAASLYRSQERLTRDVDFALLAEPESESLARAEDIIKSIGLVPIVTFFPLGPKESARNAVCMISSKPEEGSGKGIIDILLPVLPWLSRAVQRAQHNKIDLGFARVPVITPEDLVLAKCYALNSAPDRFQDLDDIKEILFNVSDLDEAYLQTQLSELGLVIPEPVRKYFR